ncbi:MAG TPA: response regulator transcription factor [Verrucomicrobiae bacterium]|nr:response regulator transcription factor [Verrucomicrobiae bacterium]
MTRIAIVEDSKVIRESLAAYVHTAKDLRCVCQCGNAEEALEVLPRERPDIVLMDIQLPNQSGIECAARLKELLPKVRIIMVTVYGDPELIFKALRAGACGYLLKRCSPEELISAIREVQEGGAPMSREIARKVISYFQEPSKPAGTAADVENLSPREREILDLLTQGFADKEIADRLNVKHGTVRWHLQNVYEKLHVRSRTEAALKFRSAKTE